MIRHAIVLWDYFSSAMVGVYEFFTEPYSVIGIEFTPIHLVLGGALIVYLAWLIINALW